MAWTVFVSVVVSIICNKVLAVHTFKELDGYIEEVIPRDSKLHLEEKENDSSETT